jgi:hypothetical protein
MMLASMAEREQLRSFITAKVRYLFETTKHFGVFFIPSGWSCAANIPYIGGFFSVCSKNSLYLSH